MEPAASQNIGEKYYKTEPTLAAIYLGAKNGREASLFAGVGFNSQNDATQYKSGNQFPLDGTAAQHLPLLTTARRHPGVVVALAAANLPSDFSAILLYLVLNAIITAAYMFWRRRRAKAAAAQAHPQVAT